jgi:hypothetical protein
MRSSVHQDFWDFNRSFGLSVGSLWVGGIMFEDWERLGESFG